MAGKIIFIYFCVNVLARTFAHSLLILFFLLFVDIFFQPVYYLFYLKIWGFVLLWNSFQRQVADMTKSFSFSFFFSFQLVKMDKVSYFKKYKITTNKLRNLLPYKEKKSFWLWECDRFDLLRCKSSSFFFYVTYFYFEIIKLEIIRLSARG